LIQTHQLELTTEKTRVEQYFNEIEKFKALLEKEKIISDIVDTKTK